MNKIPTSYSLYTYATAMIMQFHEVYFVAISRAWGLRPFLTFWDAVWLLIKPQPPLVHRCLQYRRNLENGVENRRNHLVHECRPSSLSHPRRLWPIHPISEWCSWYHLQDHYDDRGMCQRLCNLLLVYIVQILGCQGYQNPFSNTGTSNCGSFFYCVWSLLRFGRSKMGQLSFGGDLRWDAQARISI